MEEAFNVDVRTPAPNVIEETTILDPTSVENVCAFTAKEEMILVDTYSFAVMILDAYNDDTMTELPVSVENTPFTALSVETLSVDAFDVLTMRVDMLPVDTL